MKERKKKEGYGLWRAGMEEYFFPFPRISKAGLMMASLKKLVIPMDLSSCCALSRWMISPTC